jgi:hypothetical protein
MQMNISNKIKNFKNNFKFITTYQLRGHSVWCKRMGIAVTVTIDIEH